MYHHERFVYLKNITTRKEINGWLNDEVEQRCKLRYHYLARFEREKTSQWVESNSLCILHPVLVGIQVVYWVTGSS